MLRFLSFDLVEFECVEQTESDGEHNRPEYDSQQSKDTHTPQDREEDEKLV